MLRNIIERLGQIKSVLLIVISSIVISMMVYLLIIYFLSFELTSYGIVTSLLTPLIVTPIITWPIIKFLFQMMALETKMRALATKDSLTKLPTRQSFLNSIQPMYELSKRNLSNFTIVYMDVDNFKSINDTYGHAIGDKVLKSLGKILQSNKRESDLVGRLGGEEFAYALPDIDIEGAIFFAEKIKTIIEKDMFNHDGIYINYTMSFGISVYNQKNNVLLDKLISQADRALYEAKASGKNCVKVHTQEME